MSLLWLAEAAVGGVVGAEIWPRARRRLASFRADVVAVDLFDGGRAEVVVFVRGRRRREVVEFLDPADATARAMAIAAEMKGRH